MIIHPKLVPHVYCALIYYYLADEFSNKFLTFGRSQHFNRTNDGTAIYVLYSVYVCKQFPEGAECK